MYFCYQGGSFHSDQPGRRLSNRSLVASLLSEGKRKGKNLEAGCCMSNATLLFRGGTKNSFSLGFILSSGKGWYMIGYTSMQS